MPSPTSLRRAVPAALLALALPLSACGGDDEPTTKPTPTKKTTAAPVIPWATAAPAAGVQLKGTGYTFRVPKGWKNATAEYKPADKAMELAGAGVPDRTGTPPAVKVTVVDAGVDEPTRSQLDDLSEALHKELTTLVPQLKVNALTEIAGQPTLDHEGATAPAGPSSYYLRQFVTIKDGKGYTISFSFSRATTPQQRSAIIVPVLASWTWA